MSAQRKGTVDRRDFCKILGGGVLVLIATPPLELFAQRRPYPTDPNAYLRIDENGHVTLFSGKIEMGQGIETSLAQEAAEELGVPLDSMTVVMGDTDLCPWDAGTWGSLSTRFFGPAVRAAAAEARAVMLNLASQKLGVAREKLTVDNGVVSDGSNKVTYGELAKGKEITRLVGEKAVLRSIKDYKVVGKPMIRIDARAKVTGRAKYAGDERVPGMLYARLLRPPVHGATRTSLDTSKAKAMEGVIVVEQSDLVAVLHPDPEKAAAALAAIKAEWTKPEAPFDTETVGDYWVKTYPEPEADGQFKSTFRAGYLAHSPMETHTALAQMKDGRMIVWAGTQSPFGARPRIAQAIGVDESKVRVITPFVGGGFGGKSPCEQGVEAARLAQITGKPVMVMWTRPEEFFFDTFGPAGTVKVASSMDENSKINRWEYDVWAAGGRSTEMFYNVPNANSRTHQVKHLFAVGPWRAPGTWMNVFARESQIDIMANAAKVDPVEFRMRNLTDERMRKVLEAAAKAYGWKAAATPSHQGRGVALGIDAGAYVALIADVDVDRKSGNIKVKRVVVSQDMGQVVNPMGATMQAEGCVTMGLGYALSEELQFKGGDIIDRNFDTYVLPHYSEVPVIETILVPNDALSPQGGGEPAIGQVGAAIANAVFDATGARLYRMPMTPKRVLAALA